MYFGVFENTWRSAVKSRKVQAIKRGYLNSQDCIDYEAEQKRIKTHGIRQRKKAAVAFAAGVAYLTIDNLTDGALSSTLPMICTDAALLSVIGAPLYYAGSWYARRRERNFLRKEYHEALETPAHRGYNQYNKPANVAPAQKAYIN